MTMLSRLAERLLDLTRAFRFGLVGVAATLTYLGIVNLVAVPVGPLSPFHAHLVGLCGSIGLSYAGHHAFTFARKGRHGFYARRFAVITTVLFILSSAVAFACDRYLHLSAALISVLITVLYPGASYLSHSLWTFAEGRADRAAPFPP
jgi:putative flippase GtrA